METWQGLFHVMGRPGERPVQRVSLQVELVVLPNHSRMMPTPKGQQRWKVRIACSCYGNVPRAKHPCLPQQQAAARLPALCVLSALAGTSRNAPAALSLIPLRP